MISPLFSGKTGRSPKRNARRLLVVSGLWVAVWAGLVPDLPARPGAGQAEPPREKGWIGVVLPLEAVDVAARVGGRVEGVAVRVGERVRAGAILASMDPVTARQALRIAEAELQVAEAELARSTARSRQETSRLERRSTAPDLWSEEELAVLQVEARAAEAERRGSVARVEKARASVEQLGRSLEELEIRAPFAGRVALRYLDPGAVVASGTPIVRLVSKDALLVRFAVPPADLDRLALGSTVEVTDVDGNPVGSAVVRRVSPEIDLAAQRIFVEAVLEAEGPGPATYGGLGVEVRPLDLPSEGSFDDPSEGRPRER